jgi:hypothetical protein
MPFGRYRGELLKNLPFTYLEWLMSLDDLRQPLRSHLEEEYRRREFSQKAEPVIDPRIVDELVGAGLRSLSKKYHPDMGGDHNRMISLNCTADWLRRQARALA